jgi:hypothetical protein
MTSALSAGCAVDTGSDEDVSDSESEMRMMNGERLSGVSLNGVSVSGATLNGVNYTGITIGGVAVSNVYLDGTVLHGTLAGGVALSGSDFIGAQLQGSMSDGSSLNLRIDNIGGSADPDISYFSVSYQQVSNGSWVNLCGTDAQGAVKSFPLAGRWDNSQGTATGGAYVADATRFTLACRGAAIAKCAELPGYKPWQTKQVCTSWGECSTVSLQPVHQACVRMVRADYCGNGRSATVSGTEIDVFDGLGMKDTDPTVAGTLEAEWTPSGAQCVSHPRWTTVSGANTQAYIQANCPEKWAPPGSGVDCGTDESTFFVDNGYMTPDASRVFLRNRSTVH